MPALARYAVRTSLVYLLAALLVGVALVAFPQVPGLTPVYFHLFMVGWVTQFIMGVAFWMFPKFTRERPRGSPALGWVVYGLLNLGLLLRAVGEPLTAGAGGERWGWLLVASALLQWLAGMGFIGNTWLRIKER